MVSLPFPNEKRAWQPREMLMVAEALQKFFPGLPASTRVRLGMPHPELIFEDLSPEEIAMLRVWNRWADAVVFAPDRTYIIEGKIRPRLGPTEALELYTRLFLNTEEYRDRWKLPVEKVFIYAVEDPVLVNMAREKGIRTIQYQPSWLPDYLRLLAPRERRASLTFVPE
jgi:hypothetical protein